MKARTASLQVAHSKGCPSFGRNSLDSLDGCNCKPSFFTFYRDDTGAKVFGDNGEGTIVGRTRNRREADRWLAKLQERLERGHTQPDRVNSIAFPDWVDVYHAITARRVARGKLKQSTAAMYADTLSRAVDAIGYVDLRRIGTRELERFTDSYGEKASDATIGRALRELGACLNAAIDSDEGYLERNPVRPFAKKLELDAKRRGKDPFVDDELPKLWAAMSARTRNGAPAKGSADPVYVALCKVAVATGARLGELIALDWDNVSLTERTMRIEHTYTPQYGLTPPKTRGSVRTVYLTAPALAELETLAATNSTGPVFTGPHGERLNDAYIARVLARAMVAAKLPKLGENSLPRSFHSFRSTFDRQMLEQGRHPEWVRRQLGHAGLELTLNHYGTWQADAMRAEADKVDAADEEWTQPGTITASGRRAS